ncbi:MAG: hypothetical protein EP330_02810 [Deltaproteobacteria bacterium]|nr:MAG: hypothetical protein EP330_02810 [Deltaproteobacteria bacterium]
MNRQTLVAGAIVLGLLFAWGLWKATAAPPPPVVEDKPIASVKRVNRVHEPAAIGEKTEALVDEAPARSVQRIQAPAHLRPVSKGDRAGSTDLPPALVRTVGGFDQLQASEDRRVRVETLRDAPLDDDVWAEIQEAFRAHYEEASLAVGELRLDRLSEDEAMTLAEDAQQAYLAAFQELAELTDDQMDAVFAP